MLEYTPVARRRRAGLVLSLLAVAAALIEVGCGRGAPSTASPPPLRIAAATDLQRVLPELVEAYRSQDPAVEMTFGASGQLAEQIRKGAPFDVFLSADMQYAVDLAAEGAVAEGSVKPYARGNLVLAVHPSARDSVGAMADLTRPEVRKLAIANPRFAPYGAAARQALERSNLAEILKPKLVVAESVRQAFIYVERGDAEAALVSSSLIRDGGPVGVVEVDPRLYDPLIQGLGVVSRSDELARARRFVDFVLGSAGRAILVEHGFDLPSGKDEGGPHDG